MTPFSCPLIWRAANHQDARTLHGYAWDAPDGQQRFDTVNTRGLKCLIRVSQFGHTLVGGIFNCGEPLRIPRLSGTVRPYLPRIVSKFIGLSFGTRGTPLGVAIFAHEILLDGPRMQIPGKRITELESYAG
jgi:hypothetical protein